MSERNDDERQLDEYVKKQLENYYGKDVVSSVARSAPPSPPPRRARAFSFAAVICAVVFITGALMLAGAFFSGAVPTSPQNSDRDSSEASSVIHSDNTDSSEASSVIHTDNTDSSEASSAIHTDNTDSSEASSVIHSDNTDSSEASSVIHTDNTDSSEASSVIHSDNTDPSEASSAIHTDNTDSSRRDHSDILPITPSENEFTIETDPDNNSLTNPYDNVTTGRQTRAGIGIFLMIASLCSAAALYRLYNNEEDMT